MENLVSIEKKKSDEAGEGTALLLHMGHKSSFYVCP